MTEKFHNRINTFLKEGTKEKLSYIEIKGKSYSWNGEELRKEVKTLSGNYIWVSVTMNAFKKVKGVI